MSEAVREALRAAAWSPYADKRCGGLVPIYVQVTRASGQQALPVRLRVRSDSGVDHVAAAVLEGPSSEVRVSLNSHLLPNGPQRIECALLDGDDQPLWTGSVGFTADNSGALADNVRASLRRHGTPVVVDVSDSRQYDYADASLQPWFDRPDALDHIARRRATGEITASEQQVLESFVRDGFTILPTAIEEPLLQKINAELDDAVRRKATGYEYGTSARIPNLHQSYDGVRALWKHPMVLRHLGLIFEAESRPCQTLTYIFGSQQDPHQDTVHLTPFPAGYMCGVWVALEDVRENSGELIVYPGSHRLPRVRMDGSGCAKVTGPDWSGFGATVVKSWQSLLEEGGFKPLPYRPKRGSVLIWHENLMHGGSVRIDASLTRRSIVSHHFAAGCVAYYDSTGMPGYMEIVDPLQ